MALSAPVNEVMYGGARGGGKSHWLLLDWKCHEIRWGKHARGILFRRSFPELENLLEKAQEMFPPMGGEFKAQNKTWHFPSGATLKMRHLDNSNDANKYQGHEYTWAGFDEIGNWSEPGALDKIRACLRSTAGVVPRMALTSNPGGVGHNWVKARYIEDAPPFVVRTIEGEHGKWTRVFIPAKVEDNELLPAGYVEQIKQSGPPWLVRAWLDGDWDIVAGGMFDEIWRPKFHVLKPFTIPPGWTYRRGFDWGSARPSAMVIAAISDGTQPVDAHSRAFEGLPYFPRGSIIVVDELYTVKKNPKTKLSEPNEGTKLSNEELGKLIARKSEGKRFHGCVADPSIFTRQGGPSIYEQIVAGSQQAGHRLVFFEADNTRVAGWTKMAQMLLAAREPRPERPGLWVFEHCVEWIRTIPILPRSERIPDDVDTEAEDHMADAQRYLCMTTAGSALVKVKV